MNKEKEGIIREWGLLRFFARGIAFGLGLLTTALLAVTVSGTVNTFSSGEVISATGINTNFASLKTAIEGIPTISDNPAAGEGYITIGNLIIAYGRTGCDTTPITATIPTTFTNLNYRVIASQENQHSFTPRFQNYTTTTFDCISNTGTPTIQYIVIGN